MIKGERKQILVVDDDATFLTGLTAVLQTEGYTVDVVGSGKEAIEKSKNQHYSLALLEIRLPDMEGTQLLTRMGLGVPRTRTIMITGYPSLKNTVEALNRGADAYVVKPIDPCKLLQIIEEKLEDQESEHRMHVTNEESLQTETVLKYHNPL